MTKIRLVEIGEYYKDTLNDKWLLKGNPKVDFASEEYSNKIVIDNKGSKIGKILEVIGNIEEPYLLVLPLVDKKPEGKLYVQLKEKRGGKRR